VMNPFHLLQDIWLADDAFFAQQFN